MHLHKVHIPTYHAKNFSIKNDVFSKMKYNARFETLFHFKIIEILLNTIK